MRISFSWALLLVTPLAACGGSASTADPTATSAASGGGGQSVGSGGDGDGGAATTGGGTSDGSGGSPQPQSGQIWVQSPPLAGLAGKVFLAFVSDGSPDSPMWPACQQVMGDAEVIITQAREPDMDSPCDSRLEVQIFEPGIYTVHGGIYTPGETTPDECMPSLQVTVNGDTTAELGAPGDCD